MSRTATRILQAVLTSVGGLLVVPTAINIGTGGQPPDWLRPYVSWLWPVGLFCVVLGVALEVVGQREPGRISSRRPHDPRNVDLALAQVGCYVESRQRGSLAERVRVALALDERPGSVCQPAHLVRRVSGEEFQLSPDLGIADVFDRMNESMLILGAPGAGKTTQLLELAAVLVARSRTTTDAPARAVPVVVDLAQWSRSSARWLVGFGSRNRGPVDFIRWLLRSIESRYHIPAAVGRAWIEENRLTLLLDGLDEVREADREQCVRAINELQDRHGVTRLAVCSRVADYHRLTGRLRLQGAVEIRLLTRDQVDGFLRRISPRLAGAAALLAVDEQLWELLTTPLMLNIMVIAEEQRTATALTNGADAAARRRSLFDAYVVEVLARRPSGDGGDPLRTLGALRLLASISARPGGGVAVTAPGDEAVAAFSGPAADILSRWMIPVALFLVTAFPVALLSRVGSAGAASLVAILEVLLLLLVAPADPRHRAVLVRPWALVGFTVGLALVLAVVLVGMVSVVGLVTQPRPGVVAGLAVGLTVLLAALTWSVDRPSVEMTVIYWILAVGVAVGASVALLGVTRGALVCWAVGVGQGVFHVAVLGLPDPHNKPAAEPSSAVWTRRVVLGLFAVTTLALPAVVGHTGSTPFWQTLVSWAVGFAYGVIPGAFLTVLMARIYLGSALAVAGERNPWNQRFLRFAVGRGLLTVDDGEYRFIHLLLRDHLAVCEPETLADAVLRRGAELAVLTDSARASR